MGFVARWFTPSKSDNQSGEEYNAAYNASMPPAMEAAPTPENAKDVAAEEVKRQRRIRALAGGNTLLTQEGATGGGQGKSLLGS